MPEKPFQFKEFTILQDKCAMKVGTDGVLLGAWTAIAPGVESILDIGTGTGLLALQMAQRSGADIIDAVEIEGNAFEQAVENFENSIWSDRLFCYHASLQEFVQEMDEKYDLIISNPPYFKPASQEIKKERAMARHHKNLSFQELLAASSKLLSDEGSCAFIIPYAEEQHFLQLAGKTGLHPYRITRVKGNDTTDLKRSLLQLSKEPEDFKINAFSIELKRHVYTDEYIDLVKDFYLKM